MKAQSSHKTVAALAMLFVALGGTASASMLDGSEIEALVLAPSSEADAQPEGTQIVLIGSFHEIDMYWWEGSELWLEPRPHGIRTGGPIDQARDSVAEIAAMLAEAGVDGAIVDGLRLYPVEAMGLWQCLVREGCYPKGLMVGTDFLDQDVAAKLCETMAARDVECEAGLIF